MTSTCLQGGTMNPRIFKSNILVAGVLAMVLWQGSGLGTAELPAGHFVARHPTSSLEGPQEAEDVLNLRKVGTDRLVFDFRLLFDNGHSCNMEGEALRQGGWYVHREPVEVYDLASNSLVKKPCVLRIGLAKGRVRLEDVGGHCRWGYCGAQGLIDHSFPAK